MSVYKEMTLLCAEEKAISLKKKKKTPLNISDIYIYFNMPDSESKVNSNFLQVQQFFCNWIFFCNLYVSSL